MDEINKIVCKMESFIHVLKRMSTKVTKKIRWSLHESETSFPIWNEILNRNAVISQSLTQPLK